ncbi:alpha/beta fold hydrolase [Paenibacillus piscarius]|uniref:alpha/beta fold hydrolase n=1 Tax=Paenibacillus piscarius TaxID=1089681 RepID=UPI001EE94697|nr:alpha/beta hydrolase [Paenibacillus piscarius]
MPYLKLNDLDLFYELMGTGEPVIFLHSHYSRSILAFSSQLLDFQNRYACYFPDLRGHGRTRSSSLNWSTPQIAEDIAEFMERMNMQQAHLVGYSMGAGVGLYLAVNHPERVATLTAIGTSGCCEPQGAEEYEPERLLASGQQAFINQMIQRHQEAHQGNWQEYLRHTVQDWVHYPDLTEAQLSGIDCPALLISGEHDPFAGPEKTARLASLMKNSSTLIVQGASHRPHMLREQPVLVNETILEFLAKNTIH